MFGIEDAGRWSLVKRTPPDAATKRAYYEPDQDMVEHIVHALLRRYGVVFWRLLQREAAWLPPGATCCACCGAWRRAATFAAAASSPARRASSSRCPKRSRCCARRGARQPSGMLVSVSGADPLNLVGVIAPGAKVPALLNNRVLYRDGVAVATLVAGEMQWIEELEPAETRAAEDALVKRQVGSPLLAYLR